MAKAKVLLKRRKSVRNTKKITRTMEMVSTAKYKQSHGRITASAPYQEKLREVMSDLASSGQEVAHPLLETRPAKRSVVLLITSNRGLAGGYNANLIAKAREVMREETAAGSNVELEVVGKKGILFFKFLKTAMAASYDHFGGKFGFAEVNAIAEKYIQRYSAGEIDRVTVVFQRYFSAGRQAPVAQVLLPIQPPGSEAKVPAAGAKDAKGEARKPEGNYIYSPDAATLLKELLPASIKSTLYNQFLQAVVGEHLARMVAMKNATDAADKLIKRYTRLYNRARQSQITNEIAELMGGVEALK
jgi:F-type H+-transporting ATPase subunit gamma